MQYVFGEKAEMCIIFCACVFSQTTAR